MQPITQANLTLGPEDQEKLVAPRRTAGHIIPRNHITYESESYLKKILSPLTEVAGINYFCYGVNLPDTSGFTLITNTKYYDAWIKNNFPLTGFYLNSGWYYVDPAWPDAQRECAYSMGVGNIITLVNRLEDKTEIFEFGSDPDNKKIIHFYLNDHNLLTKFIFNFRQKAQVFIEEGYNQLVLPNQQRVIKDNAMAKGYVQIAHSKKNLPVELVYPFNLLSNREAECFSFLVKGYSNVEISQIFNLSPKTINGFITRIKDKLGCTSRQALIRKAYDFGLVDYFILYQDR